MLLATFLWATISLWSRSRPELTSDSGQVVCYYAVAPDRQLNSRPLDRPPVWGLVQQFSEQTDAFLTPNNSYDCFPVGWWGTISPTIGDGVFFSMKPGVKYFLLCSFRFFATLDAAILHTIERTRLRFILDALMVANISRHKQIVSLHDIVTRLQTYNCLEWAHDYTYI